MKNFETFEVEIGLQLNTSSKDSVLFSFSFSFFELEQVFISTGLLILIWFISASLNLRRSPCVRIVFISQKTFTNSKLTIETPEKGVKYAHKVNNRDRINSLTSFCCLCR